jgi:hypothetical protein
MFSQVQKSLRGRHLAALSTLQYLDGCVSNGLSLSAIELPGIHRETVQHSTLGLQVWLGNFLETRSQQGGIIVGITKLHNRIDVFNVTVKIGLRPTFRITFTVARRIVEKVILSLSLDMRGFDKTPCKFNSVKGWLRPFYLRQRSY